MHNFSRNSKLVRLSLAVAAGGGDVVCTPLLTVGFGAVAIYAVLGAVAAGGLPTLKVQGGEALDGSDKADIAGSLVAAPDGSSGKILLLDIHKPHQGVITPILSRPGGNAAIDAVFAVLYNPSISPPDVDVSLAAQKVLSEPKLGAAAL